MPTDAAKAPMPKAALQPCLDGIQREAQCVTNPRLAEVLKGISQRLFDASFRIEILARESGVSAYWLQRHFQEQLGCTVHEYVVCQRLLAARWLATHEPQNLGKLASRVGFGSYDALRASCERLTGQTPAEFLRGASNPRPEHACEETLLPIQESSARQPPKAGRPRQALETRAFALLAPQLLAAGPEKVLILALGKYRLDPLHLLEALLLESQEGCRDDRPHGVKLAGLALHALRAARPQLAAAAYGDLYIEALTALANAQRLATEWQAAERTFTQAELFIEAHKVSAGVRARFLLNKGYLRLFQRRLVEARELLVNACELAGPSADCRLKAQLLCGRGYAQKCCGNIEEAIADYLSARAYLESGGQAVSRLMLSVCTYLANAEIVRGEQLAATGWLREAYGLAEKLGSTQARQHLRWLEGLLAKAAGRLSYAERCFREARGALLAAGETGKAAMLAIDLAIVCLLRRKNLDAQQLCCEAIPMLSALELAAEELSALRTFEQAVAGSRLSMTVLRQLRTALEQRLEAPTSRRQL